MSASKRSFFDFINIFSSSEQGQFEKYANLESRKGDTKQVKLFKAVAKMESYNEWKAIKAAGYSSRNAFTKGRTQLVEQLHRFLRHLEGKKAKSEKQVIIQVHEAITEILILGERAPGFSLAKLEDTIQLAQQYHLDTELLGLLQLQKAYIRRAYLKNSSVLIHSINADIEQVLTKLKLEQEITLRYDELFVRENQIDTQAQKIGLEACIAFFEEQAIQSDQLSLKALMAYYFIRAKYHEVVKKDYEKTAEQWKAMLEFLEQDAALKNEHQERYNNIYYNYYGMLVKSKRLDEQAYQSVIRAMESIVPKTLKVAALIKQNTHYYRLHYYYIQEDYPAIIEVAKRAKQLDTTYLTLEKALIFSYHLAAAYFNQAAMEKSSKSVTILQQALESAYEIETHKLSTKTEIHLKTKLLFACIAYAQEDDISFETHYNALRYLLRDSSVQVEFSVGKQILFTLNNALKAPLDEQKFHFQKCLKQLEPNVTYTYREFVRWMETRC